MLEPFASELQSPEIRKLITGISLIIEILLDKASIHLIRNAINISGTLV